MPRLNQCELFGVVENRIEKIVDGEVAIERLEIRTKRLPYATFDTTKTERHISDVPCVLTRNKEVIKQIRDAEIDVGDIVYVKGSLSTRNFNRQFSCPMCGEITKMGRGTIVYIDPIIIRIEHKGRSEKNPYGIPNSQVNDILEQSIRVGNEILIMGRVCREVMEGDFRPGEKEDEFGFQIASDRARRIVEDGAEKTTDYPWVKAKGPQCEEYYNALHLGSSVLIQGSLATRSASRIIRCSHCNNLFKKKVPVTEIYPYFIEYINDCKLPFEPIEYEVQAGEEEAD